MFPSVCKEIEISPKSLFLYTFNNLDLRIMIFDEDDIFDDDFDDEWEEEDWGDDWEDMNDDDW